MFFGGRVVNLDDLHDAVVYIPDQDWSIQYRVYLSVDANADWLDYSLTSDVDIGLRFSEDDLC